MYLKPPTRLAKACRYAAQIWRKHKFPIFWTSLALSYVTIALTVAFGGWMLPTLAGAFFALAGVRLFNK